VFGFSGRVRASALGLTAFSLMLCALVALLSINGFGPVALAFVAVYGAANGVLTIARGTTPAELFGHEGLGALLGHLSRAVLYSTAVAPAGYSALLALGLTRNAAVAVLIAVALGAAASYGIAVRPIARRKTA